MGKICHHQYLSNTISKKDAKNAIWKNQFEPIIVQFVTNAFCKWIVIYLINKTTVHGWEYVLVIPIEDISLSFSLIYLLLASLLLLSFLISIFQVLTLSYFRNLSLYVYAYDWNCYFWVCSLSLGNHVVG